MTSGQVSARPYRAAFVILLAVATALVARFAQSGAVIHPSVQATNFQQPGLIALALPVVALAYMCHYNVIDIDRELPQGRAKVGWCRFTIKTRVQSESAYGFSA
jgi:hypothetical protein